MSLPAASILAALRRRLAVLETVNPSFARTRTDSPGGGPLGFCRATGLGSAALAGALHEVAAVRESEMAAATAFVLSLAAWTAGRRVTLWIAEDMTLAESGTLYGPGLETFGLAPERVLHVATAHGRDVPWAMEEALRNGGVGAVIGEVRDREIDLIASRRLALAVQRAGAAAFLLRASPSPRPVAAFTRWIVGAAPSIPQRYGPGPPRLGVRLGRNRRGNSGSWVLEWNSADKRFDIPAANRQPVAAADFDRPACAAASV